MLLYHYFYHFSLDMINPLHSINKILMKHFMVVCTKYTKESFSRNDTSESREREWGDLRARASRSSPALAAIRPMMMIP